MSVAYSADIKTEIAVRGCYVIHSAVHGSSQVYFCWEPHASHGKNRKEPKSLGEVPLETAVVCCLLSFIQPVLTPNGSNKAAWSVAL